MWLLASALGVVVAYRAVMGAMPPCDCFAWRYFVQVWQDSLIAPLSVAATFVLLGILGTLGLIRMPVPTAVDDVDPSVRPGMSLFYWTAFATLVAIPPVVFSVLERPPSMTGLVVLPGVFVAWLGQYARNRTVGAVGVVASLAPALFLLLGYLLLGRRSGPPII